MCFSIKIDPELDHIVDYFQALIDNQAWSEFYQWQKSHPKLFKECAQDQRIFPNYYAPLIVMKDDQRKIMPMRYRVRPEGSQQEIPSKYNVFNARLDGLEKRSTWKSIFMRNHALIPFKNFYEWVDVNGKKKLITFRPKDKEFMWAPCLFDQWSDPLGEFHIHSFAIITTEPPPEIAEQGHDRCPIFLQKDLIDDWLRPNNETRQEIYEILGQIEPVQYEFQFL